MTNLLNTWRNTEDRLANIRKNLCERGYTADAAIAETELDQRRNNRLYDRVMKKGQYRRTVCGIV